MHSGWVCWAGVPSSPPFRRPALPVDSLLPDVLEALRAQGSLVLEAAPGAGKTTRVPPALLELVRGEVLVLEPRRLAARLAARRVASEMGERVGETVGYQVRFEEVAGPRTRLRFVTEGILTRRLLSDPELQGVDAVVLDEFHERHLHTDLALAMLRRLQGRRSEAGSALKLVVMSATLESGPVARFLGQDGPPCPVLRSEGRAFPLTVEYLPYSPDPLERQVRGAVDRLNREGETGHVLVFLPGLAEIRRAMRECEPTARAASLLVLPLHGDLSPEEQDRAVAPSRQRKLLLATNVAESSVTVDGVSAVIDSGLARIAGTSPWTGLPTLQVGRVSRASARQRAGRAGRTGPGRVLRLYPEEDFLRRPEQDAPEIVRSDLAELCLALRAMGIRHVGEVEWLAAPPQAAVQAAEALLDRLGATTAGKAMELARYPLPPRLARVLGEAQARGVGERGCLAAALLGSGARSEQTDLLAAMDAPLDGRAEQQLRQLRRLVRAKGAGTREGRQAQEDRQDDDALLVAVLTGFPDRVARARKGKQVQLASGVSAELSGDPPAYEFMVVLDAEDRSEHAMPVVRRTARVEPGWLLDVFPERVREDSALEWNRSGERVEGVSSLRYDELVIEESRNPRPDAAAAAALLAAKALEAGVERFVDAEALAELLERIRFAGLTAPDVEQTLRTLCLGLYSFADLRAAGANFVALLEQGVDGQRLRELAPPSLKLPSGRQTKVHYAEGKPPWVASRLQDFFGLRETPRVGPQRSPLAVQLLAPNRRAVQTTDDLAGFWERLYPQVRRELMRRYPRHLWPEKP